ncbi:MAG: hypothetical protein K9L84_04280, partial [Candidatus Omnitrophica bacterium]|nr:hypothetical protein [Candidatus Omnitrophota bacterium]
MKKIIMAIIWFVIFQFFLGLIGGLFFSGMPGANEQTSMVSFNKILPFILLISLALAVIGTVTEKLPGTRKRSEIEKKNTEGKKVTPKQIILVILLVPLA